MKARALIGLALLAGCGSDPAPMPLAASGPVEVRLSGAAYLADLQPTLAGSELRISRQEPSFNYSEGALAKQVALQFCAGRGQRLDPAAMGQFLLGSWRFDGGCL